ncbi:MAG TPA: hypothetical protein VND93_07200 [Myxococcales bacterium]|nr:hypothetical protein [Myxococcales bacterium]
MLNHGYAYGAILADSLKVTWKVEDLIGGDKTFDFGKPFLPESLAGVNGIKSLNAAEKLKLNQIRGNSYLYLFGFVEEFILPFALEHAQKKVPGGDNAAVRALITFAEEEAKHMHLFKRFSEEFEKGFPVKCGVVGPARDVAAVVLKHGTLGVGLVTLMLEWMTQRHYVDSVRTDDALDPQFCSLLRHHWMEESQHAKLDTLLVDELATQGGPEAINKAFDDLLAIGGAFDGLLNAQAKLDLEALSKVMGRTFTEAETKEILDAQVKAYRWTFLGSGMTHPNFIKTCQELSAAGAKRIADVAPVFS